MAYESALGGTSAISPHNRPVVVSITGHRYNWPKKEFATRVPTKSSERLIRYSPVRQLEPTGLQNGVRLNSIAKPYSIRLFWLWPSQNDPSLNPILKCRSDFSLGSDPAVAPHINSRIAFGRDVQRVLLSYHLRHCLSVSRRLFQHQPD